VSYGSSCLCGADDCPLCHPENRRVLRERCDEPADLDLDGLNDRADRELAAEQDAVAARHERLL
jgi:hypothetical protein